jgi:hypothetical protein
MSMKFFLPVVIFNILYFNLYIYDFIFVYTFILTVQVRFLHIVALPSPCDKSLDSVQTN